MRCNKSFVKLKNKFYNKLWYSKSSNETERFFERSNSNSA